VEPDHAAEICRREAEWSALGEIGGVGDRRVALLELPLGAEGTRSGTWVKAPCLASLIASGNGAVVQLVVRRFTEPSFPWPNRTNTAVRGIAASILPKWAQWAS
jgi:hypothetical protein